VFNIGMAEIAVIVLLGLLVFGPDRLPKAVKTLSSGLRTMRSAATDATWNLQDAAGWDSEETRQTFSDLAELHPKRIVGSILDDAKVPAKPKQTGQAAQVGPAGQADHERPASGGLADFDPDAP
jgi:sec-independent protein translocase protein TatB